MECPLCHRRQARRHCPALGREICPTCCGTKRLVEIACPPDCGYLASAKAHPPAAVRRQSERDLAFFLAMREGLTESQTEVLVGLLSGIAAFRADPLIRPTDADLAEAASALASTLETAERGVIYEHRPTSLAAQRLVTDLKALLGELTRAAQGRGARGVERDAAVALRHVEEATRQAPGVVDEGPAPALETIGRIVRMIGRANEEQTQRGPSAIEPPRPMLVRP
jgi:hypothetical protein